MNKTIIKLLSLILLVSLFDSFVLIQNIQAETTTSTTTTDEAKDKDKIDDKKDKLDDLEDKKADAEKDLQSAQVRFNKNQSSVNLTKGLINQTESDIARRENELQNLAKRIELNKKILHAYLQEMYIDGNDPLAEIIVADKAMDKVYASFDQMLTVKERVLVLLSDINDDKNEVEKVKAELSDKVDDHEKLLTLQVGQQYAIQDDIKEAQATVSELNEKINKVRSELSQLLGSAVSFKNIIDAAKFASKVTGIRKDYLLGVLVVESNLGRYTGGCNFKESRMSGYRADVFKKVCKELDYNYSKMKVSCPPSGYKGTGGAMGVAQFMPDTWMSYKSDIAAVTGHNPPDPWDLTDGVVAMALKLTKVDGVKQHKESSEAKAYCVYLAGGNWKAYCDNKGVNYGAKVLYWADNYEKMMD